MTPRSGQSGAQAHAVQTLRECDKRSASAQRLDCVRFTAAFSRRKATVRLESDFFEMHYPKLICHQPPKFAPIQKQFSLTI
jgi:hypothetical protein